MTPRDLEELYDQIATHDSLRTRSTFLGKIEHVFAKLQDSLARGSYPKQLFALGIREYREASFSLTGLSIA